MPDLKETLRIKTGISLKENPTLADFQQYIKEVTTARGFDHETVSDLFMLFLEESGEMAKAARKLANIKTDEKSEQFKLENEVADVFIYLLTICNKLGVDLEKAFREKEAINNQRTWK